MIKTGTPAKIAISTSGTFQPRSSSSSGTLGP